MIDARCKVPLNNSFAAGAPHLWEPQSSVPPAAATDFPGWTSLPDDLQRRIIGLLPPSSVVALAAATKKVHPLCHPKLVGYRMDRAKLNAAWPYLLGPGRLPDAFPLSAMERDIRSFWVINRASGNVLHRSYPPG